jgi:SAM-dependent methyltransferase
MRLKGQRIVRKIVPLFGLYAWTPVTADYKDHLDELTEYVVDRRPVHDKRATTLEEEGRDLTITTEGLEDILEVDRFRGKRILEVGPKWGFHSRWIDQRLEPSELVLCDLAINKPRHEVWKDEIKSPTRWIYGDLREATELLELEQFDLVFFLGVLYHSVYHLQLLSMLNRITKLGGQMLLETTYDTRPGATDRLRWQPETQKAKAVPTIDALRLLLAWTGWRNVRRFADYRPRSREVIFLCDKTDELVEGTDFGPVVTPHDTSQGMRKGTVLEPRPELRLK